MPRADLRSALGRGKSLTYVLDPADAIDPTTNRPTSVTSPTTVAVSGVSQAAEGRSLGALEVETGDELWLIDAKPLQAIPREPRIGDSLKHAGVTDTYERTIVAFEPVRGPDSGAIWAYRVQTRGRIDRE